MSIVFECLRSFLMAFKADDEQKRLKLIIIACKKITDKLPFHNYSNYFIYDIRVLQSLLIASSICPGSPELILQQMLDENPFENQFQQQMWNALLYCAELHENTQKNPLFQLYESQTISQEIMNDYLQAKVLMIKEIALKYAERYIIQMIKGKPVGALYIDKFYYIFITFLKNTQSLEFTTQVVQKSRCILQHKQYFQNLHLLEEEMENLMMEKHHKNMKDPAKYQVNDTILQDNESDQSKSNTSRFTSQKKQKSLKNAETLQAATININLIQESIEKWLIESTEINMRKSETIMSCMKYEANFSILLAFLFDPLLYSAKINFDKEFPDKSGFTCKDIRSFRTETLEHFQYHNRGKGLEWFYVYRSFRVMQLLTNEQNLKLMITLKPEIFSLLIQLSHNYFHSLNNFGSLYHIGSLLNFIIQYDITTTLDLIVEYNLIWSMITELKNPEIMNVILGLLDPILNPYKIPQNIWIKFIHYLQNDKIIEDLVLQLLDKDINNTKSQYHWKTQEGQEVIQLLKSQQFQRESKTILNNDKTLLDQLIGDFRPGKKYVESSANSSIGILRISKQPNSLPSMYNHHLGLFENLSYQQILENDIDGLMRDVKIDDINENYKAIQQQIEHTQQKFLSKKKITERRIQVHELKLGAKTCDTNDTPILNQKNNFRNSTELNQSNFDDSNIKQLSYFYKIGIQGPSYQSINNNLNPSVNQTINDYSTAKLQTLYPNNRLFVRGTDIEEEAYSEKYSTQQILRYEFNAFACSFVVYQLFISLFSSSNAYKKYETWTEMLLDKTVIEIIFKNYSYKLKHLSQSSTANNSAFNCGKILTLLLDQRQIVNIYGLIPLIDQMFDFMTKLVVQTKDICHNKIKIQKDFIIVIGYFRIQLVRIIRQIFSISKKQNNLNETALHILILQFFQSLSNTQFCYEFFQLTIQILEKGSSFCVKNFLIKLNFISSLANAHQKVCFNSAIGGQLLQFYCNYYHQKGEDIECLIVYTQRITLLIKKYLEQREEWDLIRILQISSSWIYLSSLQNLTLNSPSPKIKPGLFFSSPNVMRTQRSLIIHNKTKTFNTIKKFISFDNDLSIQKSNRPPTPTSIRIINLSKNSSNSSFLNQNSMSKILSPIVQKSKTFMRIENQQK